MSSPVSNEYLLLVSGFAWSRIIVCLVILRASGRGGFWRWSDFGFGFDPDWVCLLVIVWGVVVVGAVGLVALGLLRQRQVTGMNAEVVEV